MSPVVMGFIRPPDLLLMSLPLLRHGRTDRMLTTQKASRRNFLRGWWRLHVSEPCIQAEHAADAVETDRHRGSNAAWRSSTRKNAPPARLAVNMSWSTPLTAPFGALCRTAREREQDDGHRRRRDSVLWLPSAARYGRHQQREAVYHTSSVR